MSAATNFPVMLSIISTNELFCLQKWRPSPIRSERVGCTTGRGSCTTASGGCTTGELSFSKGPPDSKVGERRGVVNGVRGTALNSIGILLSAMKGTYRP